MGKRVVIEDDAPVESETKGGGSYLAAPASSVDTISSGCILLDCVLGGGWAMGRMANIVGDKSSGKTLLAIEACANMAKKYPKGKMRYNETEAAFDNEYAATLGLPVDRVDFPSTKIDTVQDTYKDLLKFCDTCGKHPGLYIVDSWDALSDADEVGREIDEPTFGAGKAKVTSQIFRRIIRRLETSKVCMLIVSQLRDKIGVQFGEKQGRTGGRALDFYASQIVWLAQLGQIKRTVNKIERPVGIDVKARCKKNKVGPPFRECEFPILFSYGVDDVAASLQWLDEVSYLSKAGYSDVNKAIKQITALEGQKYFDELEYLAKTVRYKWAQIEKDFAPERRKYGQ